MAISKVYTGGPQTLWSNGGTTLYHAALPPLESPLAAYARVTQEMANKTGGITGVTLAARYSNDLVTWDAWAPVAAATAQTSNGTQHDDTWLDLRSGFTVRRYCQLGWECAAAGATTNQLCSESWRIEVKGD